MQGKARQGQLLKTCGKVRQGDTAHGKASLSRSHQAQQGKVRWGEVTDWLTCEGHLQAVMVVHHGGDAVKAEAIKLVLVHPPTGIGQQEPQRLPVACAAAAHSFCPLKTAIELRESIAVLPMKD